MNLNAEFDEVFKLLGIAAAAKSVEEAKTFATEAGIKLRDRMAASVAGEANPIAWRWKIRLNQAWCYDDRKPYSYPDAQPLYAATSSPLDPGTVEAWQPIETAPKDETPILLTDARLKDFSAVCWYEDSEPYVWQTNDGIGYHAERFTHWMPLPASPAPKTGGER